MAATEQRHLQQMKESQEKMNIMKQQYMELEDEFRMALTIEATRFKEVKDGFEQITSELTEHKKALAKSQQKEKQSASLIQELTAMVKEQKARIAELIKSKQGSTSEMKDRGRLEARIDVLTTEMETLKKQNERDIDALKIKAKIVDDQTETIRKLTEGLQERDEQIRKLREENLQTQKSFQEQLEYETAPLHELREKVERLTERKEEIKQQLEEKETELEGVKKSYSAMNNKWQDKAELLTQLEAQVKHMKDVFDAKEKKLVEEKEKSLQSQNGVSVGCNTKEVLDQLQHLKAQIEELEMKEKDLDQQKIWLQQSDTLLAILAPSGTQLEVPVPELGQNGQKKYQVNLRSHSGPIQVLLMNRESSSSKPVVFTVPPPDDLSVMPTPPATPATPQNSPPARHLPEQASLLEPHIPQTSTAEMQSGPIVADLMDELMSSDGPDKWGDHFPIAHGPRQSPIDVVPSQAQYDPSLKPLSIHYDPATAKGILNNGHSFQVDFVDSDDRSVVVMSKRKQFSKRAKNLSSDDPECQRKLHLVHWNSGKYPSFGESAAQPDGLAVVGVFLKIGNANPHLQKIIDAFDAIKEKGKQTSFSDFNPATLLPGSLDFWTYDGSLTTPPLLESVTWIVLKETISVSAEQMARFRSLLFTGDGEAPCHMVDNYRPTQPLKQRKVRASFK
ncbi:UNVERIFIED_CONTAM: hypothetical protein FKN15_067581 [Acipenser sinensis]